MTGLQQACADLARANFYAAENDKRGGAGSEAMAVRYAGLIADLRVRIVDMGGDPDDAAALRAAHLAVPNPGHPPILTIAAEDDT